MNVQYDSEGNLPPGIHTMKWKDVRRFFGTTAHRRRLLSGLQRAMASLKSAGCRRVYLDGSFVTDKETVLGLPPNDYDGCWDISGVDPTKLDPVLLDFSKGRAAQKAKFLGELFPAETPAGVTGRTFLEFFQIDKRTGNPKGIVTIDLRNFP
jgi:hypothetical protein